MKSFLAAISTIILSAGAATAIVHGAGPSTADLDADIAVAKAEIASAEAEAARYSGGLILAEARLRGAVWQSTLAMLEQKRTSFLRGISLAYQDPIPRVSTLSADAAEASELAAARADEKMASEEAANYAGGLLQSIALLRQSTARATAGMIEQRIALTKLGIPLALLPTAEASQPKLPGTSTSDKDALQ